MANIDIKAVYADMTKCAEVLDGIGADVKVAYTDMDDFLNKKMVFNGKQIYANWQSEARTVFEEKSKLVVNLFTTVQKECAEAANTLREVIKVYEARDSDLAANTLNASKLTKPLDFKHFGNMESAQWGTSVGGVAIKDPGISEKILDGVKAPSGPATTATPTVTAKSTATPTATAIAKPTATATPTATPTATAKPTVTPTATPTATAKPTVTTTATAKPTVTPTATAKPTVTPTATNVVDPGYDRTPTAKITPTATPTVTSTIKVTATPKATDVVDPGMVKGTTEIYKQPYSEKDFQNNTTKTAGNVSLH